MREVCTWQIRTVPLTPALSLQGRGGLDGERQLI